MPAPIYGINTTSAVALATVSKTVLGVKAHANSGLLWTHYSIGFDGVSSSAVPVIVQLCYATWATNSPGTASTQRTASIVSGRQLTAGFTCASAWTTEPTVLTVIREFPLTPNGGLIAYDWPLGTEPDSALAEGFAIRCVPPAAVNVTASINVSRA